ncbi:MAG: hypothetical protein ACLVJ6_07085 [Merdibacter sp.]
MPFGQIDPDLFGIIHAAHFADKVIAAVVDAAGCTILWLKKMTSRAKFCRPSSIRRTRRYQHRPSLKHKQAAAA